MQESSVKENPNYYDTHVVTLYLTEQLKRGLFDTMHNFDEEYTKMMAELKTKAFNNAIRQELMSERIWWLEKSASKMEEEGNTLVAEKLTETRLELRGLEKHRKVLSSLVTEEKRWMKAMSEVS